MRWLTLTAQRWHPYRKSKGSGHLYQGRCHWSLIQDDGHLLSVWRYVKRNSLRVRLGKRAEGWR